MKFICFSAILMLFVFQGYTQDLNQKVKDEKSGTDILIGYVDENGLKQGEFGQSYNLEFEAYHPDNDALNQLKYKFDDITFTIVLGTWCGDSKEQVGRFMKMLYALKYDMNRVTMIAVDREKKAGAVKTDHLDISKVPTFIVYRSGVEIGRIVETPIKSLEGDMVEIIKL